MKSLGLTLFLILLNLSIKGQISTTKIADEKDLITIPTVYDSTVNFVGQFPKILIGQSLYVKGLSESLRSFGYRNFKIKIDGGRDKSNIYKCCDGYGSKYSEMEGKYFEVLDVTEHPNANSDKLTYGDTYYLKLLNKSSKEIVFYEYSGSFESSFPFIVVGFFEKAKHNVIGKKFIFTDKVLASSKDITTAKPITTSTGQIWECIDLTIEERFYNLSLVIQNTLGEKTTISYESIYSSGAINRLTFSIDDVKNYNEKYGEENFNTILKGNVRIGMTKEMCILSWGKPSNVNETITENSKTEQWVYSSKYRDTQYLYFEGNILKAIQ